MANVVQPQYTDDTGQYDLIFSADGIAIKVNDTYIALPQYLNDLINDIKNTYANKTHTHTVSDITDFPTSSSGGSSGGEANVITSISVNGVNIAPSDKNVDITVPTKVSSLYNDSNYATTDDLAKVQINKSQIKDFTHTHDLTDINSLTVSIDELNYITGVTSSVQTQIDTINTKVSTMSSTLTNTKITVAASTGITCNIDAYKSGEKYINGEKVYNKVSLIGTASKSDAFIAESEIDLCTINITCKHSYSIPIPAILIDSTGAITQDCACYFKIVNDSTHLFLSVPTSLKSNAFSKVSISGSAYIWTEGEG